MIMIWGSLDCQWSSGSPASGPRVTVSGLAREGPRSQGTQRQSFSLPADDADSQAAHNESVGNLIIKFGRGIHHPLRLSL
jgi:hypothetical protein